MEEVIFSNRNLGYPLLYFISPGLNLCVPSRKRTNYLAKKKNKMWDFVLPFLVNASHLLLPCSQLSLHLEKSAVLHITMKILVEKKKRKKFLFTSDNFKEMKNWFCFERVYCCVSLLTNLNLKIINNQKRLTGIYLVTWSNSELMVSNCFLESCNNKAF